SEGLGVIAHGEAARRLRDDRDTGREFRVLLRVRVQISREIAQGVAGDVLDEVYRGLVIDLRIGGCGIALEVPLKVPLEVPLAERDLTKWCLARWSLTKWRLTKWRLAEWKLAESELVRRNKGLSDYLRLHALEQRHQGGQQRNQRLRVGERVLSG